jgi:hypothetical protein
MQTAAEEKIVAKGCGGMNSPFEKSTKMIEQRI